MFRAEAMTRERRRLSLIGKEDDFEDRYTAKFKGVVSGEGLFIQYERDRAALEVGLSPTTFGHLRFGTALRPELP
jgi:hypothetical protein